MKYSITLKINGKQYPVDVEPWDTLLSVLRDQLGLLGTKYGCGTGDCGACTVLVDGKALNSCMLIAVRMQGKEITTIEGIAKNDHLHTLQQTFIDHGALQCGYCTPGVVLSAYSLLNENPAPSETEIKESIAGNLCRCTGYKKIIEAIQDASVKMLEEK